MFEANQIVKGHKAGHFVIIGLRTLGGMEGAQLKAVNPANFTQTAPGEFWLPLDALRPINNLKRRA
jgi:hypothetical protein